MNDKTLTRDSLIDFLKDAAVRLRKKGVDHLVKDYDGMAIADQIAYKLDMQEWINPEREPLLDAIRDCAVDVDNDHTNREAWIELLRLLQELE